MTTKPHLPEVELDPVTKLPEELDVVGGVAASVLAQRETIGDNDPWGSFGMLGGDSGHTPLNTTEIPLTPTIFEEKQPEVIKARDEYQQKRLEYKERQETLTEARLTIRINGTAIKNLLSDNPELLPEPTKDSSIFPENDREKYEARLKDINATLEAIGSLPETIVFSPNEINLIVGENGMGKSTLLHAIKLRVDAQHNFENPMYGAKERGESFYDFLEHELDPRRIEQGFSYTDPRPSALALKIARHIDVAELSHNARSAYLDATLINGLVNNRDAKISDDLHYGRSHGQLNRTLLEGLAKNKADYEKAKRRKTEMTEQGITDDGPLSFGVGIVFIDEIENGMSPRNHRKVRKDLEEVIIPGSMPLIATNSEVLYFDPTLPRIDLEHPELGVHKPKDYPDIYDLSEYREAL